MRIGAHMSIECGVHHAVLRAVEHGFNCVQLFSHSPRVWAERHTAESETAECVRLARLHDVHPVVLHAPYLPNLASPNDQLWHSSIEAVAHDLVLADRIQADYFVFHPGSPGSHGTQFGIARVAAAFKAIADIHAPRTTVLVESTAGAGTSLGGSMRELAALIEEIEKTCPGMRIGVCIDTAHLWAAGVDLRSSAGVTDFMTDIRKTMGIRRIKLVHCNDSKAACGSKRDIHAHIGQGEIGLEGFANLLKQPSLRRLPWILETPKDKPESDRVNAEMVRQIHSGTAGI